MALTTDGTGSVGGVGSGSFGALDRGGNARGMRGVGDGLRKPWGGTTGDDCAPSRSVRAPTRNHTHTSCLKTTESCEAAAVFSFLSLCLSLIFPRAAFRKVFSNRSRDFPVTACQISSTSSSSSISNGRSTTIFSSVSLSSSLSSLVSTKPSHTIVLSRARFPSVRP